MNEWGSLLHKVNTVIGGYPCLPFLRQQCYIVGFSLPPKEVRMSSYLSRGHRLFCVSTPNPDQERAPELGGKDAAYDVTITQRHRRA